MKRANATNAGVLRLENAVMGTFLPYLGDPFIIRVVSGL
jgi:hypothetical protein